MNEPWLRGEEGGWVDSPQVQGLYELTVQDLMLPSLKQWDLNKINLLFTEEMAARILAVPLLDLIQEDQMIWNEERNGLYSVKSGYRTFMKARQHGNRPYEREEWGKLWKIHAPPKAKHFLWRLCKECIPTRMRLQSRQVQCPVDCPLCLFEPEDDWHIFFNCVNSIEAWKVMGVDQILHSRIHDSHTARDLILNICCHESKINAGKIAILLWSLWQNRNNKVWNDTMLQAEQVGRQAAQAWNDWAIAQGHIEEEQQTQTLQQQQPGYAMHNRAAPNTQQWQPPQHGYLKCNVDASFYNEAGTTGGGWCLRDHCGRFILAGTNLTNGRYPIAEGEAIALKEAIVEVMHRGFSHVHFESDSQLVIDAIASRQVGNSEFSVIISHIKSLLLLYPNFEVKFVKRQANMVAHSLARAANSMPSRYVFESIPRCIETLLINEMS